MIKKKKKEEKSKRNDSKRNYFSPIRKYIREHFSLFFFCIDTDDEKRETKK